MYSSYAQKYRSVQTRVELDHQRRLCAQSGITTLERPGGMFDGGCGVFGEVDTYEGEAEVSPEAVAPLMAALANLRATPDPTGELAPIHRPDQQ